MNSLIKILKLSLEITYIIRRKIPKRIHRIIGNQIKRKTILKNLFSLPYGIIISKQSKNYFRLIPLRKKLYNLPIIILDIQTVDVFFEVFIEESYEKYNRVKSGDVVIDIGANIGMFTIKAACSAGINGKIIAIEPEPKNIKVFKENIRPFKNVILIPKAAGSYSGKIDLMIGIHSGSHRIDIHDDENIFEKKKITVPLETLDNIVKDQNIDIINFVKIDVEGWELEVLKGAINTLEKIKFFAIASYHKKEDNLLISEFLRNYNFKVINDGKETYAWNKKFLKSF
jgi:FkbM family methyltransferase